MTTALAHEPNTIVAASFQRLAELFKEFRKNVRDIADELRVYLDAGGDIEEVRKLLGRELATELSRVAYKQLHPDLWELSHGKPLLQRNLAMLPMPEQESLAADPTIKVCEIQSGTFTHRNYRLENLETEQIHQVFSKGRRREPEEQIAYLKNDQLRTMKRAPQRVDVFEMDWLKNEAKSGRFSITFDQVERLHEAIKTVRAGKAQPA